MPDYPPGTPCWIELSSPDLDASEAFYQELFGWETEFRADPEKTGGYRTITLDGKSVGGLAPIMSEGQPPAWATYIYVTDADETVGKVKDAGGQAITDIIAVLDLGRMCVFMDPTGAAFGIWQPKEHKGAEDVNRVGTLGWNELQTRDAEKAKDFYVSVFGWEPVDTDMGGGSNYTRWQLGDRMVAGMIQMDENFPPDIPSNWLVYFGIDDTDEAVAKAQAAGGSVHVEPMDIPGMGRFAVLTDPHGAVFAIIALVPEVLERGEKQAAEIGA